MAPSPDMAVGSSNSNTTHTTHNGGNGRWSAVIILKERFRSLFQTRLVLSLRSRKLALNVFVAVCVCYFFLVAITAAQQQNRLARLELGLHHLP